MRFASSTNSGVVNRGSSKSHVGSGPVFFTRGPSASLARQYQHADDATPSGSAANGRPSARDCALTGSIYRPCRAPSWCRWQRNFSPTRRPDRHLPATTRRYFSIGGGPLPVRLSVCRMYIQPTSTPGAWCRRRLLGGLSRWSCRYASCPAACGRDDQQHQPASALSLQAGAFRRSRTAPCELRRRCPT